MTTYRHKKRGTLYSILHDNAVLQMEDEKHDNRRMVVYCPIAGCATYVRPYDEFFDGRFEEVSA